MCPKTTDQEPNFFSDIDAEKVQKSAELDIKPKLIVEKLGIENGVSVEILSEPYLVKLPAGKISDKVFMMDMLYNGVVHQFVAQATSFRYHLAVVMKKLGFEHPKELIGVNIRIWKEVADLKKFGESVLYKVALL